MPQGGRPNGVKHERKKAVTKEYMLRYQKASKKEKKTLPDEFTKLTGYHRKSAVRLLIVRPVKQVMVCMNGKQIKIKPEKKRISNRKGKRIYTDEVINVLRIVRTFFWFKTSEERKKPGFWQIDTVHHFTRSRDNKKNDNCFVEQKNGAVVREYVGYDRLEGIEEQILLSAVYKPLTPLLNFFMPTQKLKSKTRVDSKEFKVYDDPKSLFRRLMESIEVTQRTKDALVAHIVLYNQVELQHNVNKIIIRLRRRLAQLNRIFTKAKT
jgi:hypothetical protein